MPDPEALAGALEERLRLLAAMRRAAGILVARPRLGRDRLARGWTEAAPVTVRIAYRAGLGELLAAATVLTRQHGVAQLTVPARQLDSVAAALERLAGLLTGLDWRDLMSFLPPALGDRLGQRSAVAASLLASLELARTGAIELRQVAPFGPIMVRRCR